MYPHVHIHMQILSTSLPSEMLSCVFGCRCAEQAALQRDCCMNIDSKMLH